MSTSPFPLRRSLLLILLILASSLEGQDLPQIKLRAVERIPIQGSLTGSFIVQIPLKCDSKGNVYLTWYRQEDFDGRPVVRVSSDGKSTTEFSIRKAAGFEKGAFYDFTISPEGGVYLLGARRVDEQEVVRFRENGEFDFAFPLEPLVDATHIAVFKSGELLVSGRELSPQDRKRTGRLLLALYDRMGKFLQEISLPRDIDASGDPAPGESPDLPKQEALDAVYGSTNLVSADDGYVYLMRSAPKPVVYSIASSGAVVRRLVFSPPREDFHASTIKVAGGRIVIQFYNKKPDGRTEFEYFSVFDAYSGDRIGDYLSPPETGGAWACYTPNQFTLLGSTRTEPRSMALVHAKPQ